MHIDMRKVIPLMICFMCLSCTCFALYPDCRLTINVIDENKQPVQDAKVRILFPQGLGVQRKSIERTGKTNRNGVFTGQAIAIDPEVAFFIEKDGYYESYGRYYFNAMEEKKIYKDTGKLPVSIVNAVLKKIDHPVPMYVRMVDTKFPVLEQFIGYDLVKGDWVKPYGKGESADIKLRSSIKSVNWDTNPNEAGSKKLDISFSNPGDGIQEVYTYDDEFSDYKFPLKTAPEEGYSNSWLMNYERTLHKVVDKKGFGEKQNFVFRVRSVDDKNGRVTKALYGKIVGQINYGKSIRFLYYLNPDGTRNMEFDPNNNLGQIGYDRFNP